MPILLRQCKILALQLQLQKTNIEKYQTKKCTNYKNTNEYIYIKHIKLKEKIINCTLSKLKSLEHGTLR